MLFDLCAALTVLFLLINLSCLQDTCMTGSGQVKIVPQLSAAAMMFCHGESEID